MINQFENEHVNFILEEGVIKAVYKCEHMTISIARECVRDRIWLFPEHKLLMVDCSSIKKIDRDASDYLASKASAKGINRCALLVNSWLVKVIFNLYFSIVETSAAVKAFLS